MLNSSILDIAMGMVFLFVLISLLCSTINEMVAQFLCMRAKNLEAGLTNLLQSGAGNKLVSDLYNHPLINGLSKAGHKPSYIPSKNFTLALMDIMSGSMGKIPADNKSLIEAIEKQGQFDKSISSCNCRSRLIIFIVCVSNFKLCLLSNSPIRITRF
jgi:hypothetical protein